jgi:HSP20 family molecular chaperone IbpA
VDSEKINAEYKDGLLSVVLPKLKEVNPNNYRIDVK